MVAQLVYVSASRFNIALLAGVTFIQSFTLAVALM